VGGTGEGYEFLSWLFKVLVCVCMCVACVCEAREGE
jgi:hypothetical protein